MQKVDIVIGVVGALALVATVVGVLLFDSGEAEYGYAFSEADAYNEQERPVSQAFEWPTPQNATGATFTVEVICSGGQALAGGDGSITVEITGPDNTTYTSEPESFTIDPGMTCDSSSVHTFSVNYTWMTDLPDHFHGTAEEKEAQAKVWDADTVVRITVTSPNDPSSGLPLPGQALSYSAKVSGTATVFHLQTELADPQAA